MKSPTERMQEVIGDSVLQSSMTPVVEARLKTLLHDKFQDCIGDCAEFVRTSLGRRPTAGGARDQIAQALREEALK